MLTPIWSHVHCPGRQGSLSSKRPTYPLRGQPRNGQCALLRPKLWGTSLPSLWQSTPPALVEPLRLARAPCPDNCSRALSSFPAHTSPQSLSHKAEYTQAASPCQAGMSSCLPLDPCTCCSHCQGHAALCRTCPNDTFPGKEASPTPNCNHTPHNTPSSSPALLSPTDPSLSNTLGAFLSMTCRGQK